MNCPLCNQRFNKYYKLKTKPNIYLCNEHGLFSLVNNKLVRTKYPCPKCKGNYKIPIRHEKPHWAICYCEIHGEWKTSFLRSFKFRRLCSIAASKPNKSPSYYTPPERRAKRILDKYGIKYLHNMKIKAYNGKRITYYYPDFLIEYPKKIILAINPTIWHDRWNRLESEARKKSFFEEQGYEYIELTDKNYKEWKKIIMEVL